MLMTHQNKVHAKSIFRWIHRKGCSKTTNYSHLSIKKKLYSGLFLKRISEKLVDKESKVVRDRQDDNVLRDLIYTVCMATSPFAVKYTHLILCYTQTCLLKVKGNRFLLLFS